MTNSNNICPVCGYPDLEEPAYDELGNSSFEICPCCAVEFGYQDANTSHRELRRHWIEAGMPWQHKSPPQPEGWNPIEQLRSADMLD